jgi:sugar (pentulose or hexulose) kinase
MTSSVVVGLDIGTTSSKAVAWSASRRGGLYSEQPTPWQTSGDGRTEIDPYRLVDVAVDLIGSAARTAESAWGPVRVRGIGVTGLDLEPPVVPHLPLDASQPTATLVKAVLAHLSL